MKIISMARRFRICGRRNGLIIRVKKKRSGGSPAECYPTHHPRSHPHLQLGQVSPSGKTPLLTSKINFPPNLHGFRSGDGDLNSGVCSETAGSGIFHFGVLAAEEGQSNQAGLQSPLVPPAPDRSALLHNPFLDPGVAGSASGSKSSPSSAGNTPFPSRRPGLGSESASCRAPPLVQWSFRLPFLAFLKPSLAQAPSLLVL
ncbi:hypothetical protein NE237_005549 [Protea cynaroides]|uniref:Uncharacterized protein n=1 Tax=Protea cynaroides TaxID=273540 RepID=A0A9Q0GK24_9MAGN|nr:hypothetical protein NE237_005549 [Protea cynaroides]